MVYLWKVTAKQSLANKIAAGMWVEIVKTGTNARPNYREIASAFNEKYKFNINESSCNDIYFDIVQMN
ncbi:hypothetical protein M2451_003045 [Dysgonomonas sp. PFB1-18]|uniref:peptidase n=1 Tax=unclassified Dysgonomonas TaxID=2630389 RepID=UPI002474186F|nr:MULTISPECIES: peptidase [unclassified Dysgonomonas]MDH6310153.1 hypothetical protein [Dysgonomonas sp. PF1-14]MDH6340181.1 hypothetical protein [Dysgonomonas sp. PF1-16]MDH6381710.1 hypothetical protein [Dysgonomonas sp. PFB1-18]MDH6399069.1 hypothetical protein [Dysgonomonas sp. PF1-23]